jgi:hypothetical protein
MLQRVLLAYTGAVRLSGVKRLFLLPFLLPFLLSPLKFPLLSPLLSPMLLTCVPIVCSMCNTFTARMAIVTVGS